jgi:hypothetical protein
MQQDKNDIEEKLRQLDNQQLPDLSRMDEHWESMKAALQPAIPNNGNRKKWFGLIGLLLLSGTIALFLTRKPASPPGESKLAEKEQKVTTVNNAILPDSSAQIIIPVKAVVMNAGKNDPAKKILVKPAAKWNEIDLPLQLTKDSTLTTVNPNAQKILNELLSSFAKKAEQFIIDNRKDTVLFAEEGSSLFIPAGSLGGNSNVKILLKEFYKTSDIVLNKLSTTSDGDQLITGGMLHISASVNDKPVDVLPGKSIKWFLPDTSKQMEQMQLFKGELKKAGDINWINTGQGFGRPGNFMEAWVLDLRNEPYKTKEVRKGTIGFFAVSDNKKLSNAELKSTLKDKYGYYKVKIRRSSTGDGLFKRFIRRNWRKYDGIGDSAWINKEQADRYRLPSTQVRISQDYLGLLGNRTVSVLNRGRISPKVTLDRTGNPGGDTQEVYGDRSADFQNGLNLLQKKYSVDINSLGWINCDRFYNDRREKISYYVDLQDTAINYFTMMVFSEMRSVMTGFISGNKVQFSKVPVGETVKIISIGIDRKGETVMAMQETKISKKGLTGLPFESAAAPEIRSSLKKMDN